MFHVLLKWNNDIFPEKITSVSDDAAVVGCMKKGMKSWNEIYRKLNLQN